MSKGIAFVMSMIVILSMLSLAVTVTYDEKGTFLMACAEEPQPLNTIEWRALEYTWEPVVITANQVTELIGTPVNSSNVFSLNNDILVYVWNGSLEAWKQIPFQVDERNSTTGSYTINNINNVLDGYDEIVFMSKDSGDRASKNEWVVGCDAPRYEVEIADPDTGNKAWAYIYKSSRIEANFKEDYVTFDTNINDVFTESYTMGFRDGVGMIIDYFNITEAKGGDGVDLVDVLEIESTAQILFITMTFDENYLAEDFTEKKDGYVRALGVVSWYILESQFGITVEAYFNFTWKFYPEHVNATGYINFNIEGPVTVDMWLAMDHISNSIPLDFRDSGGNAGVINGINDDNIVDPEVQEWWEVSSPHGGYIFANNINLQSGSSGLKFDDDSSAPDHDNAEPGLYGRTGGYFNNIVHEQESSANFSFFPIPSNVSGVAEAFLHNVTNPLQISNTAQHSPTVWVEKNADSVRADVGDFVNYTIYLNNTGDRQANFVWINDTLPADVAFIGHDADTSSLVAPYFISFFQIDTTLYFEFQNVPEDVHYFNTTVYVNSSASPGKIITNLVHCNFTNELSEKMPASQAWADIIIGYYIILKQGWNLISTPEIQKEQGLFEVLASIDGFYDAVQWFDITDPIDPWKHHKIGKPYGNDLFLLNETMSFWIHIIEPGDTIFLNKGIQPTVNRNISLHRGWNMVGYPSLTSHARTAGLNNLTFDQEVDLIQWYDTSTQTWNDMGKEDYFVPGKGYWIHANVECEWEIPL
ncbi:MAG: DUF11 domain-containing protein [Thermoplasmata archaeon]|nr:MAG: DUF11 domain-containing protein [Thermoplasmata archaeon]